MSAGLFALLDDVPLLARLTAASLDDVGGAAGRATAKAAGVVIDDTAVTPQYVDGISAERELPIIKRIALGSLRNKLLFILPGAMLLSQFAPWLLSPILMLGAHVSVLRRRREGLEQPARSRPRCRRGRRGREVNGGRRHPHRLHPVRRDHGDRAQRGGHRGVRGRGW